MGPIYAAYRPHAHVHAQAPPVRHVAGYGLTYLLMHDEKCLGMGIHLAPGTKYGMTPLNVQRMAIT